MKFHLLSDLRNEMMKSFHGKDNLDDIVDCELGRYDDRFYLDFKYLPFTFKGEARSELLGEYDANKLPPPDAQIPTMQVSRNVVEFTCDIEVSNAANPEASGKMVYHRMEDFVTHKLLQRPGQAIS